MIRLRAVFQVPEDFDNLGAKILEILNSGAVAIEIDYDPEEP